MNQPRAVAYVALIVTSLLPIGSVFAGDYRVERPLSQGGMGSVYVVEQLSTGMRRALKLMRPELVSDLVLRERFAREARVGASIASDHVVSVLAAGVDTETGMPWLVMELLEGRDLATLLEQEGALSPQRTREIFEQLCHAIGAAHVAGVVHRDLKPENVFVAEARRAGASTTVKVLDFGIAKIIAEAKTSSTDAMGTPLWMAPEQTERAGRIGPATDVWALGLIAFAMLTGRSYWLAASDRQSGVSALLREIVLDPMAPASQRALQLGWSRPLPVGFDAWFARCTAREPRERYTDAAIAMQALAPVLAAGANLPATPLELAATSAVASAPRTTGIVYRPVGEAPRAAPAAPSRWKLQVAAAIASTVALGAVGLGVRYLKRPEVVCKHEVNDCLARCDDGGGASCALLGAMYEHGQGGAPKDAEQARRAYEKGCDKRNRGACAALSESLLSEAGGPTNPQRAFELAREGCEGSIPEPRACFALGTIHEQGAGGVSRDTVKAKSLYEHACKDKHGTACARRGAMALEGPAPNEAEAKPFLETACALYDPEGCLALGNLFPNPRATGDGYRAEQAFTTACNGGLARGCAKAARLRWPEWRQSPDWPEVARLLEKGCDGELRDALACFDRGRLFEHGLGVQRDEQRARQLYDAACRDVNPQDPEGQRACAHAHTRGARFIVDGTMLLRALEAACSGGDPTGCVELSARSEDPQRREQLHAQACAPVKVALEPFELAACARSKELQARRSSDPATAKRLFEEACAGGAGGACFELAKTVEAAWQKLPDAAKTLPAMETLFAAIVKGCRATAPSAEACVSAEALQRSRGRHEDAHTLREDACFLDPNLAFCRR